MPNTPMLEKNQRRITELHNQITELYEEINTIRRQDARERKQIREANRIPRLIKQRELREENHFGERLWVRWEEWEIDLIKRGVDLKEIARVTGRSLLSVESKIHKLKHKINSREYKFERF